MRESDILALNVATTSKNLKIHVASKHLGVRHPCKHCEHATTTSGNLKKHVEIKHEGVRYPCKHVRMTPLQ